MKLSLTMGIWLKSILIFIVVFFQAIAAGQDSTLFDFINAFDANHIRSAGEMESAIRSLQNKYQQTTKKKAIPFETQKTLIAKIGDCVSRMKSLPNHRISDSASVKEENRHVSLILLDILKNIRTVNEKIIIDFQENRLDQMKDPTAFFKSNEWLHPRYLIAFSNYWIGWTGHYCSRLFHENSLKEKEFLDEAIKAFSRTCIDFDEDSVVALSFYGRGLCYVQKQNYESAISDFIKAKSRVDANDPLYLKCRYQEAFISYKTGHPELALRSLNEIQDDYSGKAIPEWLAADLRHLRAKVLLSNLEKQGERPASKETPLNRKELALFSQLKQMAMSRTGGTELYRYVQDHAKRLTGLSFSDLGPVGAMAMGDRYFELEQYDSAADNYLAIFKGSSGVMKDYMDKIYFRISYIYYKKGEIERSVSMLSEFPKKYPKSAFLKQAVSLYYALAVRRYKDHPREEEYEMYIDSLQRYITCCDGCTDQSEAHFALGKHYQKIGRTQEALNEYWKVGKGSPNYGAARFYLLQSCVEQLESYKKRGMASSAVALKKFKEGVGLANSYLSASNSQGRTAHWKKTEGHMVFLHARLFALAPKGSCEKSLKILYGYERRFAKEKHLCLKAKNLRITCLLQLGREEKADNELNRLTENGPMSSERYAVLLDLGNRCYSENIQIRSSGKNDSNLYGKVAMRVYEALSAASDKHPEFEKYRGSIQLRLALLYTNNNELDRAVELYRDMMKKEPLSADAVYSLGLLYEKMERWQEALKTWRKFSDRVKPGSAYWFDSRYRTALALQKLGKGDKACDILTMTLVLHPDLGNDELMQKYHRIKSKVCTK